MIIILMVIGFIWSNSMDSPVDSHQKSDFFMDNVTKILSGILSPDNRFLIFFKTYVRKIAHFLEYALLGNVISLSMYITAKKKPRHFYYAFSFAIIAAVIDEYIQVFTNRGSSVKDIAIDFSGFSTGFILMTAIYLICSAVKNKYQMRKK